MIFLCKKISVPGSFLVGAQRRPLLSMSPLFFTTKIIVYFMTLSLTTHLILTRNYTGIPFHLLCSSSYIIERPAGTRIDRQSRKSIHRRVHTPFSLCNELEVYHISFKGSNSKKAMADEPGSHRANMVIHLDDDNFQDVVRGALNHQIQAVLADLESAYHSLRLNNPRSRSVQISSYINYDIRPLESAVDLNDQVARRRQADLAQDFGRLNLNDAGSVGETHQQETEDASEEETRPSLLSSAESSLDSLPVINLNTLNKESEDCPVCQETFSDSDLNDADTPVMLPCNHIIGRVCIRKWILGENNTCPMCRAAIFEPAVLTAAGE